MTYTVNTTPEFDKEFKKFIKYNFLILDFSNISLQFLI